MKLTNRVNMWVNTVDCAENFSLMKINFLPIFACQGIVLRNYTSYLNLKFRKSLRTGEDQYAFQLIRNKCMHVITYSPNFEPPHFAARGIPKNTPHGTMEGHTAYIYICLFTPSGWRFFLFLYTLSTHFCTA